MNTKKFAKDVKKGLEKKGWSLRTGAREMGMSHITLFSYTKGKEPGASKFLDVCHHLDLEPMKYWKP